MRLFWSAKTSKYGCLHKRMGSALNAVYDDIYWAEGTSFVRMYGLLMHLCIETCLHLLQPGFQLNKA